MNVKTPIKDNPETEIEDKKTDAPEYDKKSMEYKKLTFEIKNIQEDDDFFFFEGYASTFGNLDRGQDIIHRGAFVESLREFKPKVLWGHNSYDPPIGLTIDAKEDSTGLFVRARMPKSDTFVSGRIIPQLKNGSLDTMSIGFNILDSDEESVDGKFVRNIRKVFLWEYSLVTIPMNPEAVVTGIKALTDKDRESLIPKLEKFSHIKDASGFLKELGFSNKESNVFISKMKSFVINKKEEDDFFSSLSKGLKSVSDTIK